MVKDFFSEAGTVLDVYLPKDYYTKQPRGFAYVEFRDEDEAADVMRRLDGKDVRLHTPLHTPGEARSWKASSTAQRIHYPRAPIDPARHILSGRARRVLSSMGA